MGRRPYQRERRGRDLRDAFLDYVKLQSVAESARRHGRHPQTVSKWVREWLSKGSGDAQGDVLTLRVAVGILRERGRTRPRIATVPREEGKKWARALYFDVRLGFVMDEKLKAFNMGEVSFAQPKKQKKLSKVMEDAAKKRRGSKKSPASL